MNRETRELAEKGKVIDEVEALVIAPNMSGRYPYTHTLLFPAVFQVEVGDNILSSPSAKYC